MSLEELPVSYRERLAPIETIMGACVRANHVPKALARIPLTVLSNRRDDNVKAGAIEGQELALLEWLSCVLIVNCFAVLDSDQMTVIYSTADEAAGQIEAWRRCAGGLCDFHRFSGSHFFMLDHYDDVAEIINRAL